MPDTMERRSDRHTEPPVVYAPTLIYRGRVLWHHQSDAIDAAEELAARRYHRHEVRSVRVPGQDHLLWLVRPVPDRWVS